MIDSLFNIQGAKVNLFLDLARLKDFINFVLHSYNYLIIKIMGKGDKKTKRGKILMGSHGVRRPRRKLARAVPVVAVKEEKPAAAAKEKAPAKPKAVKEEVKIETPVVKTASAEEAVKPAGKKAPPKASARKETK
jgi:ribosomal small subunit protein bTHX